jgi:ribose transport system substrate-binding protein
MSADSTTTTTQAPTDHPAGISKTRHFFVVLFVTLGIAGGIAWIAGAFRPTPHFAIVTSTEDVYWNRVIDGARAAARQFDVKLDVVRSRDEKHQSETIRNLASRGVTGIGISPVNAEAQAALLKDVGRRIPVVAFDSDAPNSNRVAFIGTDNYLAGRQCASVIREAIPDGGEIVIGVGSVDNVNGSGRRQGLIDSLSDLSMDPARPAYALDQPIKAGKYTVVATLLDGGDPAKATALAADAIAKHPNLKCMVGLWSYSTPSILQAMRAANKIGQIKIVGFDEGDATLKGVESGEVFGTLVQDQYNMGYDTVGALCKATQGRWAANASEPHSQFLPCRSITNAEDVQMIRYEKERERKKLGAEGAAS